MMQQLSRYATTPWRKAVKLLRGEKLFSDVRSKEVWDREFGSGRWDQLVESHARSIHMAAIAHLLMFDAGGGPRRLLDVGCGNGALLQTLSRMHHEFEYVGTDISSEALARLQRAYPGLSLICADMLDLPAMPGRFDVIVFAECLYYVDYDEAMRRYRDKLTDNGILVVSMLHGPGRMIWPALRRQLSELRSFSVRDDATNTRWTVKAMRYR